MAKLKSINMELILILVVAFLITNCNSSPPNNIEEINHDDANVKLAKIQEKSVKIQKFARAFAKYLNNIESQKFLEDKIKNSNYVENIMEATEFLDSEVDKKGDGKITKSKLKEDLLKLSEPSEKDEITTWINQLKFGDIDVYFPVKKHRENWKAGDELLVVGFVPTDENSKEPVTAYDTEGNEILLSQDITPEIPTLVIYPSEKCGNYDKKYDSENSNKISFAPSLPPPPPPPPPGDNWYNCTWTDVCIGNDYDPGWINGAMEIYLKLKYRYSENDPWIGWTSPQHIVSDVDAGHWKAGLSEEIIKLPHNFEMFVEIWERDAPYDGNPDDFVADQYYDIVQECGLPYSSQELIRCDYDCVDFFLQDGVYPGSDYDMIQLHWNRRYAE